MSPSVQRRLSRIINIVYLIVILGIFYLFIKYCLGIVLPFVIAFFMALIVQKPTNRIYSKVKKGKGLISTLFVILLFLIVATLFSLVGARAFSAGQDFVDFIRSKIHDFPTLVGNVEKWLLKVIEILPDSLEGKLSVSINSSLERFKELTAGEAAGELVKTASSSDKFSVTSLITPIGGGVLSVLKEIPSVLVAAIISIVASCFMAADYDLLVGFVKNQLNPKHRNVLSRSKEILFSTLGKLLKAYGTIMCITFAELFIGLSILKLTGIYTSGHVVGISAITAVIDIVPVLGTGTVMIPWALYSLITGRFSLGIGLVIIYAVILVLRQILEPKLVADRLGLPPVLTIAAMYIGTQLFGFIGLFLLPIILIMIKRLNDEGVIHLWNSSKPDESDEKVPEEAENSKNDEKK